MTALIDATALWMEEHRWRVCWILVVSFVSLPVCEKIAAMIGGG